MEPEPDKYSLLEVAPDARPEVIAAAYRQLVKDYHPDLHPGDTAGAKRMKDLNEAYETLRDPEKRAKYDERRKTMTTAPSAAPGADGHLPTLVVEPAKVELRPGASDEFLRFSVHVERCGVALRRRRPRASAA